MSSENMYRLLVVTVFILFMVLGIYIGVEVSDNENFEEKEPVLVSNVDSIKIYDEKVINVVEDVLDEVNVKYTDIYPECGHNFESEEHYEFTTKSKVRDEIEQKDIGYKLLGEREGVLLYEKVHTGKCMNHYKVIIENDGVNIYRMSKNNEFELYQETAISSNMLRDGIKEKLEEGIIVDDVEELFLLMEDIES